MILAFNSYEDKIIWIKQLLLFALSLPNFLKCSFLCLFSF